MKEVRIEDLGKVITPKELGEELNKDPRTIRRVLRQKYQKQGRTWGWLEESEELKQVREYIKEQLDNMEKERKLQIVKNTPVVKES